MPAWAPKAPPKVAACSSASFRAHVGSATEHIGLRIRAVDFIEVSLGLVGSKSSGEPQRGAQRRALPAQPLGTVEQASVTLWCGSESSPSVQERGQAREVQCSDSVAHRGVVLRVAFNLGRADGEQLDAAALALVPGKFGVELDHGVQNGLSLRRRGQPVAPAACVLGRVALRWTQRHLRGVQVGQFVGQVGELMKTEMPARGPNRSACAMSSRSPRPHAFGPKPWAWITASRGMRASRQHPTLGAANAGELRARPAVSGSGASAVRSGPWPHARA